MKLYRATQKAVGHLFRLVCRPVITGQENFPATGPVIVASNHLSFLDGIIVSALMPRRVGFITKASLANAPGIKGKVMTFVYNILGLIPVDRSGQSESVTALDPALKLLADGGVFGVFPEGTRSRDGRLYRGRSGVAFTALSTGAPVVPVALKGTERLQKPGSRMIVPRKFELHIGKPLQIDRVDGRQTGAQRRAVVDRVMDAIAELSGQERADTYNTPPSVERDAARG
ncbi:MULTISPECIES: lysophospholipid acyltransferase family protein [Kocuria]|uniref:1-acyl-sn-glycerol-3-phosphate acyltransferase n=1 Tax=Kocuria subflava TaxID=1736139 RepID=A0A846TSK8_9MICC|nr:lysophospholipid acyltransferase family protein [Kocuria sp. CPCC 104605]NKE08804.1 1-acyl-sn-glycerol-3-phosphate acyltransferase [Kocuria subflava]